FAAMIVLQREPAGREVMRVPGGRPVAITLASLGFFITAVSIVLACVPPDEEPNKILSIVKVVGSSLALVALGVVVDLAGRLSPAAAAVMALALVCGAGRTAFAAPPTLRVDYYHTGNATEEHFSLDRVLQEPLPWPGNPNRPLDDTNRGKYFFEVHDA